MKLQDYINGTEIFKEHGKIVLKKNGIILNKYDTLTEQVVLL